MASRDEHHVVASLEGTMGARSFSNPSVVGDPARGLASKLRDRDHMQCPVQPTVPFRVQLMPNPLAGERSARGLSGR